jgi:hypothetical protein
MKNINQHANRKLQNFRSGYTVKVNFALKNQGILNIFKFANYLILSATIKATIKLATGF